MANVLIRNLEDDDLARLDARAAEAGLSRNEFLLRFLHQEARRDAYPVTRTDVEHLAHLTRDLDDEAVMRDAWS